MIEYLHTLTPSPKRPRAVIQVETNSLGVILTLLGIEFRMDGEGEGGDCWVIEGLLGHCIGNG